MKEAYVSFETAKLLKETGFNWKCNHYYMENISGDEHYLLPGSIMYGEDYNKRIKLNELGVNINTSSGKISAPTQQMACSWLREEYKIHITTEPLEMFKQERIVCEPVIYLLNDFDDFTLEYKTVRLKECDTNEDAIEAALQYVLTNLV